MRRFLVMLSIIISIASTYAAHAPTAPALSVTQAIIISTPSDWSLVISKTGPTMIGVGSNGDEFIPLPACSFDFAEVYHALVAVLRPKPEKKRRFEVTFLRPNLRGETTRYTDSAAAIRPLFDHARECLRSRDQIDELFRDRAYQLEELWRSRSPVTQDLTMRSSERLPVVRSTLSDD
jgi:hypothetical protein